MLLHEALVQAALEEGFPLAGSVDLEKADLSKHVERYDEWIANGHAGSMEYLVRGRDRRADPKLVYSKAQSVFCVALPYPAPPAPTNAFEPRYARYLNGGDYHKTIPPRLERVLGRAKATTGLSELEWKICVDTSAVLERAWAEMTGLGWIGKNSLLIHPKYGSYLFLAEAFLSLPTGKAPTRVPNYCGNCTRCLDACPTKAFTRPGTLDSNRCVSYLTLEKRGALSLEPEIARGIGTWVAGCDICQEVCPFNTKPARASEQTESSGATTVRTWEALLSEKEEDYIARVQNSALKRVKPPQFRRNLEIALKNSGHPLVEKRKE
jgi:epoxyqueuosine reductase